MSYSQFCEDFKKEFEAALQAKTNWGRNELMREFEWAMVKVLSKYIERIGSAI